MKYTVELGKTALKALKTIPKNELIKVASRIDSLALNPRPHDIKKMAGSSDLYRIRVGDYRIVYNIHDKILHIIVVAIGHRKEIYR